MRLYLWFAEKAKSQGHILSQKGEELKATKDAEKNMRMFLGGEENSDDQYILLAEPLGDDGPKVAMPVKARWLIGSFGQLGGQYTVVGQVDQVIGAAEELPAVRLTKNVAATPLEISTLKSALGNFVDSASAMGVELTGDEAVITGPAMWLEPLAIYR